MQIKIESFAAAGQNENTMNKCDGAAVYKAADQTGVKPDGLVNRIANINTSLQQSHR